MGFALTRSPISAGSASITARAASSPRAIPSLAPRPLPGTIGRAGPSLHCLESARFVGYRADDDATITGRTMPYDGVADVSTQQGLRERRGDADQATGRVGLHVAHDRERTRLRRCAFDAHRRAEPHDARII